MIPAGAKFDGKHTYNWFRMIPKTTMVFAPPFPKYILEDIKGASGSLDYTEMLTGKVHYQNRKGQFEFLVINDEDYQETYEKIREFFAGQKRECELDDDYDMHYTGRFALTKWESLEKFSHCTIEYNVEPYRYSNDNIRLHDWLWNDLDFGSMDGLLYGNFVVKGTKERSLWNTSDYPITPSFYCTAPMEVTIGVNTYMLPEGNTSSPGFTLAPGDNHMTFKGTGTVQMDYPLGVVI